MKPLHIAGEDRGTFRWRYPADRHCEIQRLSDELVPTTWTDDERCDSDFLHDGKPLRLEQSSFRASGIDFEPITAVTLRPFWDRAVITRCLLCGTAVPLEP